MATDEGELEILGKVVDAIDRQKTREQKIAALRCFTRGLEGKEVLDSDCLMLAGQPPIEMTGDFGMPARKMDR